MTTSTKPSSNWLSLHKSLVRTAHPRKRRKIDHGESSTPLSDKVLSFRYKLHEPDIDNEDVDLETTEVKNGESIAALRRMVLGLSEYKASQTSLGKYLALDCEMVGVGIEGSESSLARVSIVNYTGAIILDVFVRQREKVVDYRTKWSGVRSTDLTGSAKGFKEVQQTVAELMKDRVLIGHAIHNDLKALLLSHPFPQVRDTQSLAYKHRVVKSRRPALRVLVKQELGISIQGGEHSSVTDARATMALFRLYKKQFESGFRPLRTFIRLQPKDGADDDPANKARNVAHSQPSSSSCHFSTRSRKRSISELSESDADIAVEVAQTPSSSIPAHASPPDPLHLQSSTQDTSILHKPRKQNKSLPSSAHRKGTSSGISVVTGKTGGVKEARRKNMPGGATLVGSSSKSGSKTGKGGGKWWKSLGGSKKGSIKLG